MDADHREAQTKASAQRSHLKASLVFVLFNTLMTVTYGTTQSGFIPRKKSANLFSLVDCMPQRRFPAELLTKRFPVSFLSEVVYFTQPMSPQLAETVRILRRDHGLSYDEVMWALSESEPDPGQCFTFGKALTERAALELRDDDTSWK